MLMSEYILTIIAFAMIAGGFILLLAGCGEINPLPHASCLGIEFLESEVPQ
jgi:hypothetical protein